MSNFKLHNEIDHNYSYLLNNHIANIKHDSVNSFTGIGTSTPQNILDINGGTIVRGRLNMEDKGSSNSLYTPLYNNGGFTMIRSAASTDTINFRNHNLSTLFASFKPTQLLFDRDSSINGTLHLGSNVTTTEPSALLQMNSTSQGFLPPRMTATQALNISSKAEGLMVYVIDTNTTFTSTGWWGYNGSSWVKIA